MGWEVSPKARFPYFHWSVWVTFSKVAFLSNWRANLFAVVAIFFSTYFFSYLFLVFATMWIFALSSEFKHGLVDESGFWRMCSLTLEGPIFIFFSFKICCYIFLNFWSRITRNLLIASSAADLIRRFQLLFFAAFNKTTSSFELIFVCTGTILSNIATFNSVAFSPPLD